MNNQRNRSGSAVIFTVIVCLVVASAILFSLIRNGIQHRRQLLRDSRLEQTTWVLAGATRLAIQKIRADNNYPGETLTLDMNSKEKAIVDIKTNHQENSIEVIINARIGSKPPDLASRTRTLEIQKPTPGRK